MKLIARFHAFAVVAIAFLVPRMVAAQDIQLGTPIGGRTSVTGLPQYISLVYRYAIGIVATVAIIMVVYGGFRYLMGSAFSDIKRGKEIIKDALIGMIVVLGAYVILNTVNPATLTLRMPDLPKIQKQDIQINFVSPSSSVFGGNRPCSFDGQCPGANGCLLFSGPAAGDHFSSLRTATGGICTSGRAGQLCGCSGSGCSINNQAALTAATVESERSTPTTTNIRFQFTVDCQSGLDCVPERRSEQNFAADYLLPYCDRIAKVTADQFFALPEASVFADRTHDARRCSADADCNTAAGWSCQQLGSAGGQGLCMRDCAHNSAECGGSACVLTSFTGADSQRGSCSYSGALGERCRCSGSGCSAPVGVANASVIRDCAAGLVCGAVINNRRGSLPGTSVQLPNSLSWDYVCLPGSQAPAATPSAITGTCSFSCVKAGSPNTPPRATIPCQGDTQEVANQYCYRQGLNSAGSANSCQRLLGDGWDIECANLSSPGCGPLVSARCVPAS